MIKKVENLLRSYKENKAEIKMLTFRLDLNAIDYSKDNVQTSNISDVGDIVVAREKKLIQLKEEVLMTESLLETLSEKELKIAKGFYIDRKTSLTIACEVDYANERSVFKAKSIILEKLVKLYERFSL